MLRHIAALGALGLVVSLATVVPASAQNIVSCAGEGGFCRVPYPTTVIYGARGATTSREVGGGGGIPCNNRAFGDPAPGVVKRCGFVARDYDRPRGYDGDERYGRRRGSDYDREDRYERRRGY